MDRFDEVVANRDAWARRVDAKRNRNWAPDGNVTGLVGEIALAEYLGAQADLRLRRDGDGGVDVECLFDIEPVGEVWLCVDAKAAKSAIYLLTGGDNNETKPHVIYVLVQRLPNGKGECLGWAWGHEMLKQPTANWCGNGRWVHYKHHETLHPMKWLKDRYRGWRYHNKQRD